MSGYKPVPRTGHPRSDNPYGFDWGPIKVERACLLPEDRRVVSITSDHKSLDIYVSATGRSIRVFCDGKEWKP